MKKYELCLKYGVSRSKCPTYILSLAMRIKCYFAGDYEYSDLEAALYRINSFINEHKFQVRNIKYDGKSIFRRIYGCRLDIYSLTGNRILLTIFFSEDHLSETP